MHTLIIDKSPVLLGPENSSSFSSSSSKSRIFTFNSSEKQQPLLSLLSTLSHSLLPESLHPSQYYWSYSSGKPIQPSTCFDTCNDTTLVRVRINVRLRGGKGGFGTMLKAQGGKMSKRRRHKGTGSGSGNGPDPTLNDNFKTLDGRRYKSFRQAKELAAYLDLRDKKRQEAVAAKKEKAQEKIKRADNINASRRALVDPDFQDDVESATAAIKESTLAAVSTHQPEADNKTPSPVKKQESPKSVSSGVFFEEDDIISSDDDDDN
ncbi:uncharacterized protein SAPINGB_P004173 [Magnusiomyces paraingens]|uniref:SDE2-like domain-containing protein n=1 Tax=Magnusiomyces paraingens TaxID=2606893 RepID=A0A5E8BT47_9ASCO|nr:uncharacterized protein SAPINGB_P004173 [Saprochaete ingens]VVT54633.1 unnamed protein product [Saprochaete ingens]